MNGWVVLLWSFVSALVLIVVGIFVALVLMGRITLIPDAEPVAPPTPEATGVVDTSYPVMILNATPDDGLDVQMRDTLINAGWPADTVSYGPAGSQDFADTTIYYEADADEEAAIGLAGIIGGAQIAQSDVYADPNNPDAKQLVIVIGADRSASAPESTDPPAD
ncbi:MAG TPA: hypothetical protein DIW46_08480 [Microbacterium sp.]|nr:hypothetical protein [Microbacterium sp.]